MPTTAAPPPHPGDQLEIVGRYALHGQIAAGGMGVVHLGRLLGPAGFSRPVAVKRLLPQLARDADVRRMFLDEARLASRIRHPNVVPTLDVVSEGDELLLVMEYVHGEALNRLMRAVRACGQPIPLPVVLALATSVLHGLHAAHEATSEAGEPLAIVHRDVSPQNVMVGVDGVARVVDFGIARAAVRAESTQQGVVRGKIAYMAPEQLGGAPLDRRADVFAAAVILWEMLAGRRLFVKEEDGSVLVDKLLRGPVEPPGAYARGVPRLLDAIVLHGLAPNRDRRFATAREMALALEKVGAIAHAHEVGEWVEAVAAEALFERSARLKELETTSATWRASVAPPREAPARSRPRVQLPDLFDTTSSATTRLHRGALAARIATPQAAVVPLPAAQTRRAPPPLAAISAYVLLVAAIILAATALLSPRARPGEATSPAAAAAAVAAPAPPPISALSVSAAAVPSPVCAPTAPARRTTARDAGAAR